MATIAEVPVARDRARGFVAPTQLRPIVIDRIRERAEESGRIGGTANHTVMCCSALQHLGERGPLVDRAIELLCREQDADGAWPGGPHFWAGAGNAGWYESRSHTTALACESLALYLRAEHA